MALPVYFRSGPYKTDISQYSFTFLPSGAVRPRGGDLSIVGGWLFDGVWLGIFVLSPEEGRREEERLRADSECGVAHTGDIRRAIRSAGNLCLWHML